jgi:hypothetical protein
MYNNILAIVVVSPEYQEVSLKVDMLPIHVLLLISLFLSIGKVTEAAQNDIKKLIFEERRIEGKIRRPQLVLIKAEQRPEFDPMVIQSLGKAGNITGAVDRTILEESPYDGAFQFRGKKIENYVP